MGYNVRGFVVNIFSFSLFFFFFLLLFFSALLSLDVA